MGPAYKLTYFDLRGRAEPIRYLFKYGDIDFDDNRIKLAEWSKVKPTMPFGQVPILEHNGKTVNQTIAICRYLAKIVKLAGKDDWENLEIDAIVDTLVDLRTKCMQALREPDESKKKTLIELAINESLPYYLPRLEAIVQKNDGHLAVQKLTWADLFFASMASAIDMLVGSDALVKYPSLKALKEEVEAMPAIKKWIEVRPKTHF